MEQCHSSQTRIGELPSQAWALLQASLLDLSLRTLPLELAYVLAATIIPSILFWILRTDPEAAVDYVVEEPEQLRPGWKGEVLDAPSIHVEGSSAIQCYSPATGQLLGLVNPVTNDGIDRAISKSEAAQKQWAKTTFSQRRKVLQTMLKYVLENQDTIARASCLDSGKTRIDASFGETLVTTARLKWTIDHGEASISPEKRPNSFLMFYKKSEILYEPLGVIAACVSWNYPFHNLIGPIISAIFSGNGIIVKGSEQTAWSTTYFMRIAKGALAACGHNPDLVQSVICWPATASHLTSHPRIAHLTFIGSQEVAHHVAASASRALTPLCLELGGKDAAILLDDMSDVDRVVATMIRGTFQAAGQNCIAIERIICLPRIYDIMVKRLQLVVEKLRSGNALDDPEVDVGASISSASFGKLEALLTDAEQQGAKILVGGKRLNHPKHPSGHYFCPTLIVDVTPDMKIAKTEVFAPICLLMRASSIDEAIAIANSSSYGLGASVFGGSSRDQDRVVSGVKAGMVAVDDFAVYYMVQLPFGGTKASGYGRFAGAEGLRSLCNIKAVCRDRWPWLLKTSLPGPVQLPFKNEPRGFNVCKGTVEFGYGETWLRRARGLSRMAGVP